MFGIPQDTDLSINRDFCPQVRITTRHQTESQPEGSELSDTRLSLLQSSVANLTKWCCGWCLSQQWNGSSKHTGLSLTRPKPGTCFRLFLMWCSLGTKDTLWLLVSPPPSVTKKKKLHYFQPLFISYLLHDTDSPNGFQRMTQWESLNGWSET